MAAHSKKNRTATGSRQRTRRQQALRAQGATHPHPEAVTDPLFRDSAFFDPDDLMQVKYEMLRSVQQEERSVVEAALVSGLSRPAFYVTQELFQREGLPGLLPRKRGPKRPHKLSDETLAVLAQQIQEAGRMLKGEELAAHYAAASVFVFPSRTDTFGLVLLEALACGVPVAAYPVEGPIDVVANGRSGILHEDLATACLQAQQLSRDEVRAYAARYPWEAATLQFLQHLHFARSPLASAVLNNAAGIELP